MAGVKGRSGGARKGAGRPRKEIKPLPAVKGQDPLDFLLAVQNDERADPALRVKAAIAAARLMQSDEGKKVAAGKRAGKAASGGRLTAVAPPSLKVVPG